MEILTVCTGNICRSPLAELLLTTRLADAGVVAHSAGVRGLPAEPMTPEAMDLAVDLGVPEAVAESHRSRFLTERMLRSPDLILAMTRDHRRSIAELAPSRLRSTFTVREFSRLAESLTDEDVRDTARSVPAEDAGARLRAVAKLVAGRRGLLPPPKLAADDDVIDPYGRDEQIYRLSAAQLVPALTQVERVIRLIAVDLRD